MSLFKTYNNLKSINKNTCILFIIKYVISKSFSFVTHENYNAMQRLLSSFYPPLYSYVSENLCMLSRILIITVHSQCS